MGAVLYINGRSVFGWDDHFLGILRHSRRAQAPGNQTSDCLFRDVFDPTVALMAIFHLPGNQVSKKRDQEKIQRGICHA